MTDGTGLLMTLAEAGGISGMVLMVIGALLKMIKQNGCTCKFYNCSGGPLLEVDCEEGAPGKRYKPKEQTETPEPSEATTPPSQ